MSSYILNYTVDMMIKTTNFISVSLLATSPRLLENAALHSSIDIKKKLGFFVGYIFLAKC